MKHIKIMATCLLLLVSYSLHFAQTTDVILQSVEPDLTESMLSQAAEILAERLRTAKVKMISQDLNEEGQIHLRLEGELSPRLKETLLTKRAALKFSETVDRTHFFAKLPADDPIYSWLDIEPGTDQGDEGFSAKLGDLPRNKVGPFNAYLQNQNYPGFQVAFGLASPSSENIPLYLLAHPKNGVNQLTGSSLVRSTAESSGALMLSFDKLGAERLAELTKTNMGKSIAITLDGEVLMAPLVKAEISGGNLQVTGDFTVTDGRAIAAILQHGELPAAFKMIQ